MSQKWEALGKSRLLCSLDWSYGHIAGNPETGHGSKWPEGPLFFKNLYRMTCPIGGVTHICPIPISMFNYKMVYIHTHTDRYIYIYDMISIIFPCISCIVPFHSSILMIENDGFSCRFAKHNPLITRMRRMRDRNPTSRSRRYTPVVYQWPSSTQTRLGDLP